MSFDIFLQAFEHGEAAQRDGRAVRELLLAAAERYDADHQFVHAVHGDGEADVYGVPHDGAAIDGLMFNHVAGGGLELLVEVARTAGLVVIPVGCPVCLVDESQRQHLPAELAGDRVEVVTTGEALRRVIERG